MVSKKELIEKIGDSVSISEAVDMGIAKEKEVKKFYQSTLEKEQDESLKSLFKFLMNEEDTHVAFLEDFKALFKEKSSTTPMQVKNFKEYVEDYSKRVPEKHFKEVTPSMSEISILLAAMRVERSAEDFYTVLAEKSEEEGLKAFFTFMAEFERRHYNLLDGILEESTSFRMQT